MYLKYLLCLQSNASGRFFANIINFVEQQLKFSHFKGRIYTLKQKLYIYIIIFCKHLSELHWIVFMFLDCQCILDTSTFNINLELVVPPLPPCPHTQVGQAGGVRSYENYL